MEPDDKLAIVMEPIEPVRHPKRPGFLRPGPTYKADGLPDGDTPIVPYCRDCARYANEEPARDAVGNYQLCPTCKAGEQLVSVQMEIPERSLLKMKIAQAVRDLDEQGLQNVLAAIAAERTRQGLTQK